MEIDDSGIDSDQKPSMDGEVHIKGEAGMRNDQGPRIGNDYDRFQCIAKSGQQPTKNKNSVGATASQALASIKRGTDLQRKLQKQRDAHRKSYVHESLTKKTAHMVSRSRLIVPPSKTGHVPLTPDHQPLVLIASDASDEDETDEPMFSRYKTNSSELTRQLIKDGYNLDVHNDEEDELDLIPPKPINRCLCCQPQLSCTVQ